MDQPIPQIGQEDVERIVRRDFPPDSFNSVMAILNEYGQVEWEREANRVRLAALKLADGQIDELRRQIDGAKADYRDVIAPAEYPEYTCTLPRIQKLSDADKRKAIDQDWKQYQFWLKKEGRI